MKIMIVDDEPEILGLIRAMIEPLECEVLAFADSREAAACVGTQSFDGIFLDVEMPHINGIQLTESIRSSSLNGKVPIVILTGSDDIQTMRQAFKAGATYFLCKPVSQERIHTLFNAVLGPMLTQRRKYARLPFQTSVNCSTDSNGKKQFTAASVNIGEGGMKFESLTSVEVGQLLNLEFYLPTRDKPLHLLAKVHRMTPPDFYGVEFIQPADSDRQAIQDYVVGTDQE